MYKVLVADDEYYVRERLKCCIEWEKYGFVISAEAEDGEQALRVIESIEPHLVVADIEMPFISGIHLARILHERKMDVKLIFLTGFDKFEYARSAIQYGVLDYILKPIEEKCLISALQSIRELLDRQKIISEKLKWSDRAYEKIKDNLLQKLHNRKPDEISEFLVNVFEDAKSYHYSTAELEGISRILLETAVSYYTQVYDSMDNPYKLFEADKLCGMNADQMKEYFINIFISKFCNTEAGKTTKPNELVEAAKKYIHSHYSDPELSLTTIARNIFVNPSYLSRVFNQFTGQSIPAYTEELRLSNALNLIREGCTSINAVALKNGYKNAGYFSKCFKVKYGINPSELIKND